MGFNKVPLAGILIDVLANHPELATDDILIIWTIEQEMLLETTIGELRGKKPVIDETKRDHFRELALSADPIPNATRWLVILLPLGAFIISTMISSPSGNYVAK